MTPRTATLSLGLLTAALCAAASSARAEAIEAHLTRPVMIGSSFFASGVLTIAPAGSSSTALSIQMDGRQVALAFKDGSRPTGTHCATRFVFHRDLDGVLHLAALRYVGDDDQVVAESTLRVAVVSPGLSSRPTAAAPLAPTLTETTR